MTQKPFAPSADNNKQPILDILALYLKSDDCLLELGSGTGQHICFFADAFRDVSFQPSDLEDKQSGIKSWISDNTHQNILPPLILNVSDKSHYPKTRYNCVFSANTTHIMSIEDVAAMFHLVGLHLKKEGVFLLYGPFNIEGQFTSESNRDFNDWLQAQGSHMGIRDIETLTTFAKKNNLSLSQTHTMPKNNQVLVFIK
jgi:cyclopropane fatty-acyl-phospholipid synthase-like methyltransferase